MQFLFKTGSPYVALASLELNKHNGEVCLNYIDQGSLELTETCLPLSL